MGFWILKIQDTLLGSIELVIWTYIFTKLIELAMYLIKMAIEWVKKSTSHVVVHVYLPEVERWIMLDPSFNAYLVDEDNSILNIIEILERHNTGKPIYIGQYSFNKSSELFKEHYVKRFIITAIGRISIGGGNSYEERKYFLESYNLIPQNMNYKGFLEKMMTLDI